MLWEIELLVRWKSTGVPASRHCGSQLCLKLESLRGVSGRAYWARLEENIEISPSWFCRRASCQCGSIPLSCTRFCRTRRVPSKEQDVMRCLSIVRSRLRPSLALHRSATSRWLFVPRRVSAAIGEMTIQDAGDGPMDGIAQSEGGPDDALHIGKCESPMLPGAATDLPLSPLMDPRLIAARERYRTPKPAPSGELSAFSKKLQDNPYGKCNRPCCTLAASLT